MNLDGGDWNVFGEAGGGSAVGRLGEDLGRFDRAATIQRVGKWTGDEFRVNALLVLPDWGPRGRGAGAAAT